MQKSKGSGTMVEALAQVPENEKPTTSTIEVDPVVNSLNTRTGTSKPLLPIGILSPM